MSPGKSPPNSAQCIQVPIRGSPSVIEEAARMPVPTADRPGSEYPKKPSNIARISSSAIIQLASRGRRNAPVKNTRARWTMMDAAEQQRRPVVDPGARTGRPAPPEADVQCRAGPRHLDARNGW